MHQISIYESIDKLTNSIENTIAHESFSTLVTEMTDWKRHKPKDWVFEWEKESTSSDRKVYKLTTIENPNVTQGLISISIKTDHIFCNLVENAKFNKGQSKLYRGVLGNLMSYACLKSFELGYEGFIAFYSKTKLIEHYEKTLNAKRAGGLMMFIDTPAAYKLVNHYFPAYFSK